MLQSCADKSFVMIRSCNKNKKEYIIVMTKQIWGRLQAF